MEGSIARERPSDGNVRKTVRATDVIEMGKDILSRVGSGVKWCDLIESPSQAALRAHAVVASDINHKCVVTDSQFLETIDQSSNLVVRVFAEASVVFHQALGDLLLIGAELIPVLDARRPRREFRGLRHHAELPLAR